MGQARCLLHSWFSFGVVYQNQAPTRKTSQHFMFNKEALSRTYREKELALFEVIVAKICKGNGHMDVQTKKH